MSFSCIVKKLDDTKASVTMDGLYKNVSSANVCKVMYGKALVTSCLCSLKIRVGIMFVFNFVK